MSERLHNGAYGLEIIAGSMFSGKTGELLDRIAKHEIAQREVQLFKPRKDDRWGLTTVVRSHSGAEREAIVVEDTRDLYSKVSPSVEVIGIDEVQFLDPLIVPAVRAFVEREKIVICSGLPTDFKGDPFGSMAHLLVIADSITRLNALCTYIDHLGKMCRAQATRTQRIVDGQPADFSGEVFLIGEKESYEARCPRHNYVPGKPSACKVFEE
jgi:thymidine kinase